MTTTEKEKILIIDDEEEACEFLKRILERHNYIALTAANGEEGLALVKANPDANIVFTDIFMPKMDGLEFLQLVRQFNPKAEVIMMTGHTDKQTPVEAVRYSASGYLLKPLEAAEVMGEIKRALIRIQEKEGILRKAQAKKDGQA